MLARLSLAATFLASFSLPAPAQDLLDDLVAVHPDSIPGAIVSDPDGRYVFRAEGGTLAALTFRTKPKDFDVLSKRPIGATGVRPVRMILDPEADLAPGDAPGHEDLLYVAGGRSGLWVVRADLRPIEANLVAARVDDSTDLDPATQDSRRWCTDVDVMTVGGVRYLLALFAARSDSHLRVYCLDDVRAVAAAGVELGRELSPLLDVPLLRHPAALTVPAVGASEALAMAMAVDGGYEGTVQPGAERAAVFVAMGSHGLVRVTFRAENFPDQPCDLPWSETLLPPAVHWGPVYGDGTWANTSSYPDVRRSWYESFTYDVGDPDWNRTEPPRVLDVAVQNFAGGYYLYAVIDQRGWVRYRIGPAAPWGVQINVDHHEGVVLNPATHPWGQTVIRLLSGWDSGGEWFSYPMRIQLVKRADGGAALVVTTAKTPSAREHGHLSEQASLGHVGDAIGGVVGWEAVAGDHARSIVYAVPSSFFGLNFNYTAFLDAGGYALFVPAHQTTPGELRFFGGSTIADPLTHNGVEYFSTFRAKVDLAAGSAEITHRRRDPVGRLHFSIASSILDPDVLFTSTNDGGFFQDGILTTCPATGQIVAHYDPQEGCPGSICGNDMRGSTGMLLGDSAQWPHATNPAVEYVMGARAPMGEIQSIWSLAKFDLGSERCSATPGAPGPQLLATWFLSPPSDRFGGVGRGFFQTAHTDAAYNAEHDKAGDWEVVFAARVGTPGGIVVLRRDLLENWFETGGPGGGPMPDGTVLDLDPASLPPGLSNPIIRQLDTRPELANVPSLGEQGAPGDFMAQHPALAGATFTVHPKLFKVPGPGSTLSDTWVLGVPSGTNVADPDLFATLPARWAPDPPYDTTYNHSMLQFWEVQDPSAISPTTDLPVIIGGDEFGSAFYMDTVEADLDPAKPGREVYAFVTDSGGRVLVYDVTRLLQPTANQPELIERWLAPPAVSDGLPSSILNLAVDHQLVFPPRVYVYAPVMRSGIAVLSFDPMRPSGQRLLRLETIQTPGEPFGVALRTDPATFEKTLLVTDHVGGVRIYGTPP